MQQQRRVELDVGVESPPGFAFAEQAKRGGFDVSREVVQGPIAAGRIEALGGVGKNIRTRVAHPVDAMAESHETLAPIQTTSTTSTTLPTTTTQPQYYEVQSGDTLTKIAAAFGLPIPAIMELNGIVDPNAIQAGQILQLPLASEIVVTSLPPITTVAGPTALPAVTTAAP